jgi:hypothetical protein
MKDQIELLLIPEQDEGGIVRRAFGRPGWRKLIALIFPTSRRSTGKDHLGTPYTLVRCA